MGDDFIAPSVEDEILTSLLHNEEFARSVSPFIKKEYFTDHTIRVIFDEFDSYIQKYSCVPTKEALILDIEVRTDINQDILDGIINTLGRVNRLSNKALPDLAWITDTAEKYFQDRAIYLAVTDAIGILEGENPNKSKHEIPSLLSDALSVGFQSRLGHNYLDDVESRWEFYNRTEERMRFSLDWFNLITNSGIPKKTLTCILAPTNAGKTLIKTHLAADFLMDGKNVLYITMEMAEERISERIDANLLDIDIGDLAGVPKDVFTSRLNSIRAKTQGKLFVKEYPTAGAHVGHFRHLLNELKIKENFVPDVVFIDYLNICASSRIKNGENTYVLVKSIAEELRGMAVEYDLAIITSTQTNRSGWNNSDLEMSDTSESAGLPATVDLFLALIVTEELTKMGQIMIKQLKNRFTDVTKNVRRIFNIDRPRMRIFECEDNEFNQALDSGHQSGDSKPDTKKLTFKSTLSSDDDDDPFANFKI